MNDILFAVESTKPEAMTFVTDAGLGRRKVEVLRSTGNADFLIMPSGNGKFHVKDYRQDKDNALIDAYKGYGVEEFKGVLTKMIGKDQSEACIKAAFAEYVQLSDGNRYTIAQIFEMIEREDSLDTLVSNGFVTMKLQVYMNFKRNGMDAEAIFNREMQSVSKTPKFSKNYTAAKYDKKGEMTSPWWAWQGTVFIGKKVSNKAAGEINEIVKGRSKIFDLLDGAVIHSNALTKSILEKIEEQQKAKPQLIA